MISASVMKELKTFLLFYCFICLVVRLLEVRNELFSHLFLFTSAEKNYNLANGMTVLIAKWWHTKTSIIICQKDLHIIFPKGFDWKMRIWKKCYTSIFAIVTLSLAMNNKVYVLFFMVHLTKKIKQRKEKKKKLRKKLTVSRIYFWKSIPNNTQCKNSFAPTKADPRDIPVNAQYKNSFAPSETDVRDRLC